MLRGAEGERAEHQQQDEGEEPGEPAVAAQLRPFLEGDGAGDAPTAGGAGAAEAFATMISLMRPPL